jgi:hypothetical protein
LYQCAGYRQQASHGLPAAWVFVARSTMEVMAYLRRGFPFQGRTLNVPGLPYSVFKVP